MTLQEKIENVLLKLKYEIAREGSKAEMIEKIADDFAIDFAEWFWQHQDAFYSGERDYYLEFNQILEIYKKEKGL